MVKHILVSCTIAILWLGVLVQNTKESEITVVSLVVGEDHIEAAHDFVELSLKVQGRDTSLTEAIQEASKKIHEIEKVARRFCLQHTEKEENCEEIVDAGQYTIEPEYQQIKGITRFLAFKVEYEATLIVFNKEYIGEVSDELIPMGVEIGSYEWGTNEDELHEDILEKGMEMAKKMCEGLGETINRIVSVEVCDSTGHTYYHQEAEDDQAEEEEEEEEEGVDIDGVFYEFTVECVNHHDSDDAEAQMEQEQL